MGCKASKNVKETPRVQDFTKLVSETHCEFLIFHVEFTAYTLIMCLINHVVLLDSYFKWSGSIAWTFQETEQFPYQWRLHTKGWSLYISGLTLKKFIIHWLYYIFFINLIFRSLLWWWNVYSLEDCTNFLAFLSFLFLINRKSSCLDFLGVAISKIFLQIGYVLPNTYILFKNGHYPLPLYGNWRVTFICSLWMRWHPTWDQHILNHFCFPL